METPRFVPGFPGFVDVRASPTIALESSFGRLALGLCVRAWRQEDAWEGGRAVGVEALEPVDVCSLSLAGTGIVRRHLTKRGRNRRVVSVGVAVAVRRQQ